MFSSAFCVCSGGQYYYTASRGEQFVIRLHPAAARALNNNNPTSQPLLLLPHGLGPLPGGEPEMEHLSNLTLRKISGQDVGQYRRISRNEGCQVEANVFLLTPPAPVIIMIEEEMLNGLNSSADYSNGHNDQEKSLLHTDIEKDQYKISEQHSNSDGYTVTCSTLFALNIMSTRSGMEAK